MRRPARSVLLGVVALVAMSSAPGVALRADDAKDAAAQPERLAIRLEPRKTYFFRLTESARLRVPSNRLRIEHLALGVGDAAVVEVGCEVTWEAGVQLIEALPDGGATVWLLPARVSGRSHAGAAQIEDGAERLPGPAFDSDDGGPLSQSPFVGRALKVRLAPDASVVEATAAPLAPAAAGAPPRVDAVTPSSALAFAQRFFQSLPAEPPRAKTSWDTTRQIAPELGPPLDRRIDLGEAVEVATIEKVAPLAVHARIRLMQPSVPPAAPTTPTAEPGSEWRTSVLERELTGLVTISRATGLVESRETSVHVKARRGEVKLPGGTIQAGPGGMTAKLPESAPAQDEVYEIETRLVAVPDAPREPTRRRPPGTPPANGR